MTNADLKAIRDAARGFSGRFFFDAEAEDIGYIAKNCDERTCDCEQKLNSDGEQDCSIQIADYMEEHVAEPMVAMLNAVPRLLDEVERLRAELSTAETAGKILGQAYDEVDAERDSLRSHYNRAAPEHNLLALLDLYEERADKLRALLAEACQIAWRWIDADSLRPSEQEAANRLSAIAKEASHP